MSNSIIKYVFIFFVLLLCAASCSKDVNVSSIDKQSNSSVLKTKSGEILDLETAILDMTTDELAEDYYENLIILANATDALCLGEGATYDSSNPFSQKLASLNIVDENDIPISFFSMSNADKQAFFHDFMLMEADDLADKLEDIPDYIDDVYLEDVAMASVIDAYGLDLSGSEPELLGGRPNGNNYKRFGSNNPRTFEEDDEVTPDEEDIVIIDTLRDTLLYFLNRQPQNNVSSLISNWLTNNSVPTNTVLSAWTGFARRGDIVLSLPIHGCRWSYINIFNYNMFGHAGIFTQTITNSIGQNDEVTIETRIEDGVDNYNATYWTLKHYVLGIQDVKYKLTWQGFTLGVEKICTPVSNPGLLATMAESQLGKDYVSAPEFIIPKIVAPTRFTCTSLVWWCAKECYNIDVSDWFSPIVSPSAVYRSKNTYVRKSVTP